MAKKKPAPVASIKHKDKRPNIPTRELRGFVEEAENKPMTSTFAGLLYARDPSLDPQLVWKGKDELDRGDLTVPCVPIYIQEKIHPHAIIDDIANRAAKKETPPVMQADVFADFNGLDDFSKKVDFYHWGVHWSNRMILGDSLFVMTSLADLHETVTTGRTGHLDAGKGPTARHHARRRSGPQVTLLADGGLLSTKAAQDPGVSRVRC